MHRRAIAVLAAAITAATIAIACTDRTPTQPGRPLQPAVARAVVAPRRHVVTDVKSMTPDDLNDSIAAHEPGFGGAFTDDNGNLVVWATDVTRGENIRGQLVRLARLVPGNSHATRFAAASLIVRKGDYSVADLNRWREALEGASGFHWTATDVDEQTNRIWIGVDSTPDIAIVRKAAATLNIPQAALNVERVKIQHTSAQYLNGYNVSPVAAGLGVYVGETISTATNYCTIGMIDTTGVTNPGMYGLSNRGFITAFHCINEPTYGWAKLLTTATPTYDSLGRGTQAFGIANDPHSMNPGETKQGWTCPSNPPNNEDCTFADVAEFFLDSSIATKRGYMHGNVNTTVTYGVIAPTIDSVNTGWNNPGSLQIDSTRTLEMEGENASGNMFVGDVVHKIGAGTGHTYGTITRTCTNVSTNFGPVFGNMILFCQMYGSYYSSFGDSGAPVYYNPSIPYYEGLSWGTAIDSTHSRSVFSPSDFVHMTLYFTRKLCFYCNFY
jgi:hypothetical protein